MFNVVIGCAFIGLVVIVIYLSVRINDLKWETKYASRDISKLRTTLGSFKREIGKLEYIGEVYIEPTQENYIAGVGISICKFGWNKFKKSDIQEKYDGGIKIFDRWHDKKDVIYYNNIEKEKKKVEKRYKKDK